MAHDKKPKSPPPPAAENPEPKVVSPSEETPEAHAQRLEKNAARFLELVQALDRSGLTSTIISLARHDSAWLNFGDKERDDQNPMAQAIVRRRQLYPMLESKNPKLTSDKIRTVSNGKSRFEEKHIRAMFYWYALPKQAEWSTAADTIPAQLHAVAEKFSEAEVSQEGFRALADCYLASDYRPERQTTGQGYPSSSSRHR